MDGKASNETVREIVRFEHVIEWSVPKLEYYVEGSSFDETGAMHRKNKNSLKEINFKFERI